MIALVRHGQSTSNAQGLVVGRGDPPLTEMGQRQARALAPWLENVREVWTSPLLRAKETAALAMPELVAVVKDSFVELDYGSFEGALTTTAPGEGWRALELRHDQAFGGGESLAQLDERVHRELDALLGDATNLLHSQSEHLAIVSHVSPIKSAVAWALGAPGTIAWRMRLDNGSLTLVGARNERPRLIRYNAVPTLA
ncbi:MAG TPA: histidine phosphatase family protein [Acidimicrobiales bacterium]|nr:histidine phosphatase family protein [Acidimicrobiales bacterium]